MPSTVICSCCQSMGCGSIVASLCLLPFKTILSVVTAVDRCHLTVNACASQLLECTLYSKRPDVALQSFCQLIDHFIVPNIASNPVCCCVIHVHQQHGFSHNVFGLLSHKMLSAEPLMAEFELPQLQRSNTATSAEVLHCDVCKF